MKYIIREELTNDKEKKNAVGKARSDVESIAKEIGYEIVCVPPLAYSVATSHATHLKVYENLMKNLPTLQRKDELIIQLPLRQHTILLPIILKKLRKKGVKIYGFLHDLEIFRYAAAESCSVRERVRRILEEKHALKQCDAIIVHNNSMKNSLIKYGFNDNKIVSLEIFDYLSSATIKFREYDKSVIIAGNLSKEKSPYAYILPSEVKFNLYGIEYTGNQNDYIKYHGSFLADELQNKVEGSFGLVWDGDSIETCSGLYGRYLRINNPHKTSFYLSCGIPVMVWKKAAIADFILQNGCGIVLDSLMDIQRILNNVTEDEYSRLQQNAYVVAKKLKCGYYTKKVIKSAELVKD